MDLLAQSFESITFEDVANFCAQKIVESTELDYKKAIPRDVAKHIAAMSNQYGGLIIVGVEEDPKKGTPSQWHGVANEGKLVERIHQVANNVRPLPSCAVRTTNEVDGKVFLLIRVDEGDAPPYTTVNDPTVYLRTGNVTTPLRQAEADIVRTLVSKRASAESQRTANLSRARAVLESAINQTAIELSYLRRSPEGKAEFYDGDIYVNQSILSVYLQPFFPARELALPRAILAKLPSLRVVNYLEEKFPDTHMRPIARGMLSFLWTMKDAYFTSDQVYANGFFYHAENTIGRRPENDLFLADIGKLFYAALIFGHRLYDAFGYSGLVRGGIRLNGVSRRRVRPILRRDQPVFADDFPITMASHYSWPIEADTHQLGDEEWVNAYFVSQMREMYWDLGIADVPPAVLENFIKGWRFR